MASMYPPGDEANRDRPRPDNEVGRPVSPRGVPEPKVFGTGRGRRIAWHGVIKVSFLYMFEFEFDAAKGVANLEARQYFTAAQSIWRETLPRIEVPARSTGEPRWMVIGGIDGQCCQRS
jgi:hypothetical protein